MEPERVLPKAKTVPQPQQAQDFKVVCDSMLGGLAKNLRKCNCDVEYMEFDTTGDKSASLAIQNKRILLTKGTHYKNVCN